MKKTKIFICAHKKVELPKHPFFLPVQAGAALHDRIPGFQPDDEGDNISDKNPHFCELTCHYWAWKNLKEVDIVGLNHYRRYFDFSCSCPQWAADKRFVDVGDFLNHEYWFPDMEAMMDRYDIVLPVARHWRTSNTQQYYHYHIARDWEMLRQIIKDRTPEYLSAFERTMDDSNVSVGYNMFITRWGLFDAYSSWLFDILFEVERRVPPIDDPIQSRIYGYMSERLINVFCERHHLHVKHIPLVMPIEDCHEGLNISPWHATLRRFTNDLHYEWSRIRHGK